MKASTAFALDGVWINPSGGSWTNVDDWLDNFVADGTDGIADFSTLDILADVTMHLGSARTIGQLKFGDTTPSNNWLLDNNGFSTNVLTLSVTSGSPNITVVNDGATISATLAGTQGIAKSGAGALNLNGNNTFTGGVTINAGYIQLANAGALNSTTPNAVAFGPNSSGTLSLNGNSVTISGLSSNSAVGTPSVRNGGAALAYLTVNNAEDNTFAGILRDGGNGALGLIKSGAGTLTLSGNNTFTGGVLINGGTVQVASAGALNAAAPNQVFFNASSTGVLSLNGNSVTINGLDTDTPSGTAVVQNASALNIPVTLTVQCGPGDHIYAGVLQDGPGAGKLSLTKTGEDTLELEGANTFTGEVNVKAGTLVFKVVSGSPTVGTGVTATVASGATLELAGSVSALANGANRVNIMNNSNSTGLFVSGSNQQVGNIDGAGSTQIIAGSDLTANHIIQSALAIGGASGSPALVTIAASDASGNPLFQPSGPALAGSLSSSGPGGAGGISFANLSGAGSDLASLSPSSSIASGNPSLVPEPSTLLLVLLGIMGLAGQRIALRPCSRQ